MVSKKNKSYPFINLTVNRHITSKDYSHQNLQKSSFENGDLRYANFSGSDLRGANFSGANLTGADLTKIKTGIPTIETIWIFIAALLVSLLSGYMAFLTGATVHAMLASKVNEIRAAGIISSVMIILFIALSLWKGVGNAFIRLIVPVSLFALVIGIVSYASGFGNGSAMLQLITSLLLVVVMFAVGTTARAAAGSLSNILFLIVALSGGIFGRNIGGGIGTVIMALACMQISKRALSGAKGFEALRKVAFYFTRKFGTSFHHAKLVAANLSNSKLRSTDFSGADTTLTQWDKTKKA